MKGAYAAVTAIEERQRKLGLFALLIVSAFNYIDRTILSILQIPIKDELGLTDGQLGALTGLAFALFYATLSLPVARLADRYNRRAIVAVSIALWSAMTATCGLATGFASLAFFRIGVAIGEAGSVPASVSIIADYYPAERRASALATWGLALPIGLLFGYSATGWLATEVGWRNSFYIIGGLGVALAPVTYLLITEPVRGRFEEAKNVPEDVPPLGRALSFFWHNPAYRILVAAGMLHGFSQYAMMTWNAPFFSRTHGLTLTQVASLMALLGGVAGAIGIYASGILADRLGMRDARWRVWVIGISVAATVPAAIAQYLAPSLTGAIAAAVVASILMTAYYGPLVAATQSVTPSNMRALSQAVLLLVFNLFGLGLGPLTAGLLSDWLNSSFGTDSLRYSLIICLVPSFLSAVLFFYVARTYAAQTAAAIPLGADGADISG